MPTYRIQFIDPTNHGLFKVTRFGLRTTESRTYWHSCRVRQDHDCAVCRAQIAKGSIAFRPVGNHLYRYERICQRCMKSCLPNARECPVCRRIERDLSFERCCDGPTDYVRLEECSLGESCRDENHHFGIGRHVISLRLGR